MLYTDVGQQAVVYVPTEFYGCILVVIINKHGVIIGHFAREKSGNVVCMQDQMSFDDMISKLEDAESEVDVDNVADTREWIIYSNDTSTRSPGYRAIINKLVDADAMNIPKANIVPSLTEEGEAVETLISYGTVVAEVRWYRSHSERLHS